MIRRRVTCQVCGREFSVKVDGLLRSHIDKHIRCPGSLRKVADDIRPRPEPGPGRASWPAWVQSLPNERRSADAARRDVELAGKLLASGSLDDRAALVALARVSYPQDSWRQIGATLGLTKDAAVSVFRRRCEEAGLR